MSLSTPTSPARGSFPVGPDEGLFPISVVTELTGVGAHTLRGYERAGLLRPRRTDGGMRRYSSNDLAVVRRAAALSGEGINLAGIRRILALESEVASLRAELDALRARMARRSHRRS
ncbi:MerR family transcriptional regulator [Micromonospora sp. NPDC048930]|uniref:MerR family transcriptional regulator n=1 Tax=Micromonospora sp. NPDC048930 TaxID=3364261 RepID=UPI00371C5191